MLDDHSFLVCNYRVYGGPNPSDTNISMKQNVAKTRCALGVTHIDLIEFLFVGSFGIYKNIHMFQRMVAFLFVCCVTWLATRCIICIGSLAT
mgnify:CR=1 FL=1